MDGFLELATSLLLGAGAFFYLVSAIGLVRMPDVFTRMHAASVSDTLGAGLLIAGMLLAAGFTLVSAKLAIIFLTIVFTSPVATHALAQAAMHAGVKPMLKSRQVRGLGKGRALLEPKSKSTAKTTAGRRAKPKKRRGTRP